jgi:hypothetical protein
LAIVERAKSVGLIDASPVAAVDATGLETRHVSEHFGRRRGSGSGHRQRAWPKLTAVLHIHLHLIIGAVTGVGPSQDSPDFTSALRQAAALVTLSTVLADAQATTPSTTIVSAATNSASSAASLP